MAFVNLVSDADLAMSLVHGVAVINGWPLPRHDPALDVNWDDKDDPDAPPPSDKPKTKRRLEKERLAAEARAKEREAKRKEIEAKRAAEALVWAEIKKNAVYTKLMGLADVKAQAYDELFAAVWTASPKMAALTEAEFDLLYSLSLSLWSSAKSPERYVTKFMQHIVSAKKYPLTTLKLLLILFNALNPDPRPNLSPLRYAIFTQLLKTSLETDNAKALDGQFKHVEAWSTEWKLSAVESAELLSLVSTVLKAAGNTSESQNFALKYLNALETVNDKKAVDAGKPTAYAAVLHALGSSTVYQFDSLLALSAVKALSGDAKFDAGYSLLSIFTSQNVEAYTKFTGENKDFIAKAGLNGDDLLRKIRTLTLCTLGNEKERYSFDVLKQRLQLPDANAVESAVLDAVISQCVEAKIDEATEEVIILRASRRTFDSSGWKALASQLGDWKKNVSAVLSTLHQIQYRGPAQGAAPQDHKS